MNFHGKDIKIFTGSSNVDVAQGIAGCLGLPLVRVTVHSSQTAKSLFLFTNLFVAATALLLVNLRSRQRQSYGNAHND